MTAVTILGSGVALGVYVPALLVDRHLARRGVATETLVVESLYSAEGLAMLERCRVAYQRRFALALLAHRMLRDLAPAFDEARIDALIDRWQAEDRRRFVVWSGLWIPVLQRYREIAHGPLDIDFCRIDATISASFRVHQPLCEDMAGESRDVWLWNQARNALDRSIPVTEDAPLRWHDREDRLVTHGGGWGLGTYRECIPEIESRGFLVDVVVRDASEAGGSGASTRCFMVDPNWRAWQEDACRFPPFGVAGGAHDFRRRDDYHEIFDLVASSRAIVSKPGGGTLIDSLASATPVVLLEPYGYAEEANAAVWETLGLGVRWDRWRENGFSMTLLEELHENLLAYRETVIDYPAEIAAMNHEHAA
jgi:hypothetical protein